MSQGTESPTPPVQRLSWRELGLFLLLAFGIWPVIAVGVVGGFGFLVWFWQMIFGPPGPPMGH